MSDDENFNFDEAYDEKVNKIQQANKEVREAVKKVIFLMARQLRK